MKLLAHSQICAHTLWDLEFGVFIFSTSWAPPSHMWMNSTRKSCTPKSPASAHEKFHRLIILAHACMLLYAYLNKFTSNAMKCKSIHQESRSSRKFETLNPRDKFSFQVEIFKFKYCVLSQLFHRTELNYCDLDIALKSHISDLNLASHSGEALEKNLI